MFTTQKGKLLTAIHTSEHLRLRINTQAHGQPLDMMFKTKPKYIKLVTFFYFGQQGKLYVYEPSPYTLHG